MKDNLLWIVVLIVLCAMVSCQPVKRLHVEEIGGEGAGAPSAKPGDIHTEVVSVSVTSSVVRHRRPHHRTRSRTKTSRHKDNATEFTTPGAHTAPAAAAEAAAAAASQKVELTEIPPSLEGANFEFIKQLNAKKTIAHTHEPVHPFQLSLKKQGSNDTDDSLVEESLKTISTVPLDDRGADDEFPSDVPLARSIPASHSSNYYDHSTQKPFSERRTSPRLTTAVSFNIVHDTTRVTSSYEPTTYVEPKPVNAEPPYSSAPTVYSDTPKVYSEPAKVYSEPAKVYSEPAKVYSEPAKVYGEPAKVYGEPAKIYSEPAKFYSEPASLYLDKPSAWSPSPPPTTTDATTAATTAAPEPEPSMRPLDHQPEKNYEVDEKVSVKTEGRVHGVQDENCKHDNCKVGYVVEGRQYRKYRVEERTADGYIVGEYGVVRHEDGALRGVRYTADSDASPRLIYDALMKFLQL